MGGEYLIGYLDGRPAGLLLVGSSETAWPAFDTFTRRRRLVGEVLPRP